MSCQFSLGDHSALKNPGEKRQLNREMFAIIAPRYRWITQILSFGQDRYWKQALINGQPCLQAPHCLDLACGTGDITRQLANRYPQGQIIGIDLCPEMLQLAKKQNLPANCQYVLADMLALPVADDSVDIITGGYALRNAPDLDALLQVVYQKLKPGGFAAFLDFSRPAHPRKARRQAQLLKFWTRLWGMIFHGNADVYGYISASLALFPNTNELQKRILSIGFQQFSRQEFLGGFTALVKFCKP
jgi:ubiquinone/menaquinone biosynthesis methyltransferase